MDIPDKWFGIELFPKPKVPSLPKPQPMVAEKAAQTADRIQEDLDERRRRAGSRAKSNLRLPRLDRPLGTKPVLGATLGA